MSTAFVLVEHGTFLLVTLSPSLLVPVVVPVSHPIPVPILHAFAALVFHLYPFPTSFFSQISLRTGARNTKFLTSRCFTLVPNMGLEPITLRLKGKFHQKIRVANMIELLLKSFLVYHSPMLEAWKVPKRPVEVSCDVTQQYDRATPEKFFGVSLAYVRSLEGSQKAG